MRKLTLIREESCCGFTIRKWGRGKLIPWLILDRDGKRLDSALTREVARRRARRMASVDI